jgi:hypothetical protein
VDGKDIMPESEAKVDLFGREFKAALDQGSPPWITDQPFSRPDDIGFHEDSTGGRNCGANTGFGVVNDVCEFRHGEGLIEFHFGGNEDLLGSDVLGPQRDQSLDRRSGDD